MQQESLQQKYESLIKSTDGPEDLISDEEDESTHSRSEWEAANEEE